MRRSFAVGAVGFVCGFLALGGAAPGRAAVLCAKKTGVLVVESSACKKKETPVDLSQFGAVGPRGPQGVPGAQGGPGATGPAGSARAYALVDTAATLHLANHVTGVTHPLTGVYCLTTDLPDDPDTILAFATPQWIGSSGNDLFAFVATPHYQCPAGTFEVRTYQSAGSYASSDTVEFFFVIP